MLNLAHLVILASSALVAAEPLVIQAGGSQVTVDPGAGTVALAEGGTVFARGRLRSPVASILRAVAKDPVFGEGQAIAITYTEGGSDRLMVYPGLPFALLQPTFTNPTAQPIVLNRVPVLSLDLDLGAGAVTTFGTGGLNKPQDKPGSYAWMAFVHPEARDGVVAGWLTQERGDGIIAADGTAERPTLSGRAEYGRLPLAAGAEATGEILAVGRFADARLGLEYWADAVAKRQGITLRPMPIVYCTWYDNVHGRASDAKHIAELAEFAARELKPYGFTCVQIDDGWQVGDNKGNGPRKVFNAHDPKGPYAAGMQPTAKGIADLGMTPGLWLLPFGGTWNDPFFAAHQDWFVQKDGKPFDTAWGGTCLDMTHPEARAFVAGEVRQIVKDWGYRYIKIDGLSTGCGVRPQYVNAGWQDDHFGETTFKDPSVTNLDAYRLGLRTVREAAGNDTFILGCCAAQNMRSYAGSFGLVDAMRTGPDNNGSWAGWLSSSPLFGARHHHLHGRIWYNDPDPIYVRSSLPLESARCIASWNAIAGQMISLSDWLPGLPAERLDILKRVMPSHRATARAADLFQAQPQRVWTVTDQPAGGQRRDVLGLFNWDAKAERQTVTVASLGLPPAERYVAYDFWHQTLVPAFRDRLEVEVPAQGCRILAVRPLLDRPFLLSTSRHVTQGILEVKEETWDAARKTLAGRSDVVGGDAYELRLVARDGDRPWPVVAARISPEDVAAGVTIAASAEDGVVRVAIRAPANRMVTWSVEFAAPATALPAPAPVSGLSWKAEDQDTLVWSWTRRDGTTLRVARDDGAPQACTLSQARITGLEPERTYRFTFTAVDLQGRTSAPVEQTVTMPKGRPMAAALPLPTVSIATLKPTKATTNRGHVVPNMSNLGGPILIAGETRSSGVGVCAPSTLSYAVQPGWRRFVAVAGINDEVKSTGACVVFRVLAEGADRKRKELAVSPRIRAGTTTPFWRFDVALPEGITALHLVAEDGEGPNPDNHADWADAGFLER